MLKSLGRRLEIYLRSRRHRIWFCCLEYFGRRLEFHFHRRRHRIWFRSLESFGRRLEIRFRRRRHRIQTTTFSFFIKLKFHFFAVNGKKHHYEKLSQSCLIVESKYHV